MTEQHQQADTCLNLASLKGEKKNNGLNFLYGNWYNYEHPEYIDGLVFTDWSYMYIPLALKHCYAMNDSEFLNHILLEIPLSYTEPSKLCHTILRAQCKTMIFSNITGEWKYLSFAYFPQHYTVVIMTTMASQITSLTVVYSIVYTGADQRKHQSSASLAFVRGIHRDRWIPRTNGQ